jgi:putative transposase
MGMPNKLIAVHEQYERLGKTDGERQLAYRDLFGSELDSSELGEIRDTVNRGWPLGSERFKDEIERAIACAGRPPKRDRSTRSI